MSRPLLIPAAPLLSDRLGTLPRRIAANLTSVAMAGSMLLAASLPVQAAPDGKDLAKLLLGALVVGAIIHEVKKDDDRPAPTTVDHRPHGGKPGAHGKPWNKPGNRPAPQRLPSVCAIEIDAPAPRGRKTHMPPKAVAFYPERCLRDMGLRRADLPKTCAIGATLFGQRDRVYAEDCLREAGFRAR